MRGFKDLTEPGFFVVRDEEEGKWHAKQLRPMRTPVQNLRTINVVIAAGLLWLCRPCVKERSIDDNPPETE
ncbi:MAG: hypothetical protein Rhims3KO_14640 [Hyphomicrobiales bacterium]